MNHSFGKLLFLTPYPFGAAPSQRFRFEQYIEFLEEKGFKILYKSFWSAQAWKILYIPRNRRYKIFWLLWGFIRRFWHIIQYRKAEVVFIHREADPLGSPVFPYLLKFIFKKKLIYDFDDAIWIPNSSHSNKALQNFKFWSNTSYLCKKSDLIHAGNEYLANYARKFNSKVKVIPTTINTQTWHNKVKVFNDHDPLVVGWTGSHSTLFYLYDIYPVLKATQQEIPFEFLVICDVQPESIPGLNIRFIPWRKESEVNDLLQISIGIMPLRDDQWSRGKCGFKAIQYMSLGIPALVSPVGVNTAIVDHGINGFHCSHSDDWGKYITLLHHDRGLLRKLGAAARPKIESHYSVHAIKPYFLNSFIEI